MTVTIHFVQGGHAKSCHSQQVHYNATSAACARTALHSKQSKLSNLAGSNKQQDIQSVHQIEQLCKSANITVLYRRTRLTGNRLLTGQQLNKRVHGYPDHPFHPYSVLSPCLLPYLTRYPVHIWLRPTTLHFVCCRYCCLCLCVCQYMWSEKLPICKLYMLMH